MNLKSTHLRLSGCVVLKLTKKRSVVAEKVVEIINDSKLTESEKQDKVYHLITTLNPK